MNIDMASRVGRVGISGASSVNAVNREAPDVTLPAVEGAASEAEVREFLARAQQQLSAFAAELGDPETALMAMSNIVERSGMSVNRAQVDTAQQARQAHILKQAEAAKKASEDQKSAAFWGVFAKVAAYVGAAVGIAASIAAIAVTGPGGVAGVAAIVGLCASGLGAVGQASADIAREVMSNDPSLSNGLGNGFGIASSACGLTAAILGIIANPLNVLNVVGQSLSIAGSAVTGVTQSMSLAGLETPPWLALAAGATGAVGGGIAAFGRGASQATSQLARTIRTVGEVTNAAGQATSGAGGVASALFTSSADQQRIEARVHGQSARKLMESIQEITEDLRDLAQSVARQRGRAVELGQERAQLGRNLIRA